MVLKHLSDIPLLCDNFKGASAIGVIDLEGLVFTKVKEFSGARPAQHVAPLVAHLIRVAHDVVNKVIFLRFVSGHTLPADDNQMVAEEMRDEEAWERTQSDYHESHRIVLYCHEHVSSQINIGLIVNLSVEVNDEMAECVKNTAPLQECYRQQEHEERLVVPTTDARSQPFAVMIESVCAIPTKMTVKCSFWSEYQTSVTILKSGQVCPFRADDQLMHHSTLVFASRAL